MRILRCCFAVLVVLPVLVISLVLLPTGFPASAAQNVKIQKYEISGTTAEELQKQLWGRFNGDNAAAVWNVRWRYVERVTPKACIVTKAATATDMQFIFPEWADATLSPARLQRKWRAYLGALKRHEDGHMDIGLGAARTLWLAIRDMSAKDCVKLKAAVDMTAKDIIANHRLIEQDYDANTDNGALQGADIQKLE